MRQDQALRHTPRSARASLSPEWPAATPATPSARRACQRRHARRVGASHRHRSSLSIAPSPCSARSRAKSRRRWRRRYRAVSEKPVP